MKLKSLLLAAIILAAGAALSACSAPPPHETKMVYHPLGNVGLGMTVQQVEKILGSSETMITMEDAYLIDYDNPEVDLIVSYEAHDNTAFSMRTFGPGKTFNGITVGMAYAEALTICGQYAVEEVLDEDGEELAISLLFNAKNEPISVTYEEADDRGQVVLAPVFSDDISHVISFEFRDGLVYKIELQYP